MAHPYKEHMEDKAGKAKATKIAGSERATFKPPSDNQQKPQFPEDQHGPGYGGWTPNNWLRGMPSAEGKPGFDHGKKGK